MHSTFKIVPMVLVGLGLIAATSLAQKPAAGRQRAGDSETLEVKKGHVQYLEISAVSALREGVLEKMELRVGSTAEKDDTIGILHNRMAQLAVTKAELTAYGTANLAEAKAKRELAISVLARARRLEEKMHGAGTKEDLEKAEAEFKVADAMLKQSGEKTKVDTAELDLAKETLSEHTIRAPFSGIITEQLKYPGESVRANEPVVRLANLDRLRVSAYIPLQYAFQVKKGMLVDVRPDVEHVDLPIERKQFRGKITFIDPEVQLAGEETRRIFVEVENNSAHELEPGLVVHLTVYLNSENAPPPPTDSLRQVSAEEPQPVRAQAAPPRDSAAGRPAAPRSR